MAVAAHPRRHDGGRGWPGRGRCSPRAGSTTPAPAARSHGERPSGSVWEKKPRAAMSALKARASAASGPSCCSAGQPTLVRSVLTSASTSASRASAPPEETVDGRARRRGRRIRGGWARAPAPRAARSASPSASAWGSVPRWRSGSAWRSPSRSASPPPRAVVVAVGVGVVELVVGTGSSVRRTSDVVVTASSPLSSQRGTTSASAATTPSPASTMATTFVRRLRSRCVRRRRSGGARAVAAAARSGPTGSMATERCSLSVRSRWPARRVRAAGSVRRWRGTLMRVRCSGGGCRTGGRPGATYTHRTSA